MDLQSSMSGEYHCRASVNGQSESASFNMIPMDEKEDIQTQGKLLYFQIFGSMFCYT